MQREQKGGERRESQKPAVLPGALYECFGGPSFLQLTHSRLRGGGHSQILAWFLFVDLLRWLRSTLLSAILYVFFPQVASSRASAGCPPAQVATGHDTTLHMKTPSSAFAQSTEIQ